ncbi:MAG: MBL fold metallo-hydrolase, partial [Bacteroidota bacterium]
GCHRECCQLYWEGKEKKRSVVALGIVDPKTKKIWMIDASPDFPDQLKELQQQLGTDYQALPAGIFLSHAHIGHYTGLMYLGREVIGADKIPVYAMPLMERFLKNNGPWNQLIKLNNIQINPLKTDSAIQISKNLRVRPFLVPHRQEYSETVGFWIEGPRQKILYITDIDKWDHWERDIREEIKKVDVAFLDATFYNNQEIPHRDMSEIPHPFIEESLALFTSLSPAEKAKVHFIHFNHSNPVFKAGAAGRNLEKKGYHIAKEGQIIPLE